MNSLFTLQRAAGAMLFGSFCRNFEIQFLPVNKVPVNKGPELLGFGASMTSFGPISKLFTIKFSTHISLYFGTFILKN